MSYNIALDGPAGAGKSTIAKAVAQKLNYIYVDTGALYRSIAYTAIQKKINLDDKNAVINMLPEINIELKYVDKEQHVFVNTQDVSDKIRQEEISMGASVVSSIPEVRHFLFDLQKNIAKQNNIIMDGRDIGTVVLPDADVKIFLTASAEKRAERRYNQHIEKGEEAVYEDILKAVIERDKKDETREISPLKKAEDAIEVDTSEITLIESINNVYNTIVSKLDADKNNNRKSKSPVRIFFYGFLRAIGWIAFHSFYNLHYIGKENIPKKGSYIFASNHRSYTDPVIISIPTRVSFSYMAKEELFKNKLFSLLIRSLGAFPVSRGKGDTRAIDESMKRLNEGSNLIIFPEGSRSMDGTVGKGKTGVALIAAKAGVPVIPVGIIFKGSKLKFRQKVIVAFGKEISPEELKISSMEPRELKELKLRIMKSITELVEENVNKL